MKKVGDKKIFYFLFLFIKYVLSFNTNSIKFIYK